jgi:DNA primase
MGQLVVMTKCPFHGDTDPSLAIYDDGYYCFGCKKKGKLEQWMIDLAQNKPVSKSGLHTSNVVRDIEQYDYRYSNEARKFFKDRHIRLDIAKQFELKHYNNKILSPLYNMKGEVHGKQVRYINRKPKYRLIPRIKKKEKIYPTYTRCIPSIDIGPAAFVVESVYDAAKLYQATSLPSIAILGTNMRPKLIQEMYMYSRQRNTKWIVFFDPDAIVVGRLLSEKLLVAGLQGNTIVSNKKPYEYTDDELEELVNGIL